MNSTAGMVGNTRLNRQRRKLKPSEKKILAKTVNPCFGTFKCATKKDAESYETSFKSPVECPAGVDCIEEFTCNYICEETGMAPYVIKSTRRLRKLLAQNLKRVYLSQGRKTETTQEE